MPGDSDDAPLPRRGLVRPPPSDAPDQVEVPRMNPPPPSLEAMVPGARGEAGPAPSRAFRLWFLALVVAAAITAYVVR